MENFIGVESTPTLRSYANATGSQDIGALERAVDRAKSTYEETKKEKETSYARRLQLENDELASLRSRRTSIGTERRKALADKASYALTREQKGSTAQRNDGTHCAKGGWRLGDGMDNGCLSVNTRLQNAAQAKADDLQRQYDDLGQQIISQQAVIVKAEVDLKNIDLEIKPLQTAYKNAEAELEKAKALNNEEALKARAALAAAEGKAAADLQKLQNELAIAEQEALLKDALIDQESDALQASADLQKSSMPMVIGFIGLVVLSFIIQPMLKKKA